MDVTALRARSVAFWDGAAPGWVRHAARQDAWGAPLGAVALERLAPSPGERILDVGCGCGGTTAQLAAMASEPTTNGPTGTGPTGTGPTGTGPTGTGPRPTDTGPIANRPTAAGSVVGVDLVEGMVVAARERFPGLTFYQADIETVGVVAGAPFDAAYSRMVLMLLADPLAGLATIRRSLRPGGRLAATVFRDGRSNPWLPAAMLGAAPHVGAMPPLPVGDEPGPFAFAAHDRIRGLLTAAGFEDIQIIGYDVTLDIPDSAAGDVTAGVAPGDDSTADVATAVDTAADDATAVVTTAGGAAADDTAADDTAVDDTAVGGEAVAEWLIEVGPAGAAYRSAPPAARAAARGGAARLLARYREPGVGYTLPSGIWLLTATAGDYTETVRLAT